MKEELLTIEQAASLLGRHPGYLRLAIRRGILSSRRIGPIHVLTHADLDHYRDLHMRPRRVDFQEAKLPQLRDEIAV